MNILGLQWLHVKNSSHQTDVPSMMASPRNAGVDVLHYSNYQPECPAVRVCVCGGGLGGGEGYKGARDRVWWLGGELGVAMG